MSSVGEKDQQVDESSCPLCHRLLVKHLVDFKSAAMLLRRRACEDPEKLKYLKGAKSEKEHERGLVEYIMTCFPDVEFVSEDLADCQHESLYNFFQRETKLDTRSLDYLGKRLLTQVSEVRYTLESLTQQVRHGSIQCKLCVNSITEERETYIKRKQANEQKSKVVHCTPMTEEPPSVGSIPMDKPLSPGYFSFGHNQPLFGGALPMLYIFPTMQ